MFCIYGSQEDQLKLMRLPYQNKILSIYLSYLCVQMQSSKFISNFQVHVGAATNYSLVPWGGVAFNAHDAMQFCREELLTT